MKIHSFLNYIHSSKRGVVVTLVRALLYAFSLFFRLGAAIKNAAYDGCYEIGRGVRYKFIRVNIYNFKARIISIGNIVAGGTGKTPLTELIAKEILKRKKSLAILSRGYKAKMEKDTFGPQLICEGKGPMRSAKECGDEPYLISKNVPKILFYVGKNRVEAARMAIKKGAKILLLDDGMQYRKLHRGFEIVIMDAKDPFGKGYFLPRGFLRDHPKSLARADLIVINHISDSTEMERVSALVKKWSKAPITGVAPSYLKTLSIDDKESFSLKGKKVAAFCGIAKPAYFYQLLENEGAEVIQSLSLGDHEKIDEKLLEEFSKEAYSKEADLIVCTEKDAVKITEYPQMKTPLAYIKMELKVKFGERQFEEALAEMV